MEDWIDSIKQAVQEDRLRRRRTKGQSRVMSSAEDTSFESYNNESGLSYQNKVDSGEQKSIIANISSAFPHALCSILISFLASCSPHSIMSLFSLQALTE